MMMEQTCDQNLVNMDILIIYAKFKVRKNLQKKYFLTSSIIKAGILDSLKLNGFDENIYPVIQIYQRNYNNIIAIATCFTRLFVDR